MKKLLLTLSVILLAVMLAAQAEEAISSLDAAKELIKNQQYVKAQDEINFALAKINEILAEELLKFIPENPEGFKLEDKDAQALGAAGAILGSANSIAATGDYSKGDASFKLTISVGGVLGQAGGLMGMAAMFGGMNAGGGKTIRVLGYSGTQEYDKGEKTGTLTIQVGDKITVMVEGDEIDNADLLKSLAEKVDLAKLEKSF